MITYLEAQRRPVEIHTENDGQFFTISMHLCMDLLDNKRAQRVMDLMQKNERIFTDLPSFSRFVVYLKQFIYSLQYIQCIYDNDNKDE
jgi:hypothetical protein